MERVGTCATALPPLPLRRFLTELTVQVKQKVKTWTGKKQPSDVNIDQLEWSAHVVQYVTYIYDLVQVHKNSKNKSTIKLVPKETPLLGPHFSPPSYIHRHLREALPTITPTPMYLRPLHVIHPLFYPNIGRSCPACDAEDVRWHGWTNTGPREVHGVQQEEMAIGYQLRCDSCNRQGRKHCLATTSREFWDRQEHWQIPCEWQDMGGAQSWLTAPHQMAYRSSFTKAPSRAPCSTSSSNFGPE